MAVAAIQLLWRQRQLLRDSQPLFINGDLDAEVLDVLRIDAGEVEVELIDQLGAQVPIWSAHRHYDSSDCCAALGDRADSG